MNHSEARVLVEHIQKHNAVAGNHAIIDSRADPEVAWVVRPGENEIDTLFDTHVCIWTPEKDAQSKFTGTTTLIEYCDVGPVNLISGGNAAPLGISEEVLNVG